MVVSHTHTKDRDNFLSQIFLFKMIISHHIQCRPSMMFWVWYIFPFWIPRKYFNIYPREIYLTQNIIDGPLSKYLYFSNFFCMILNPICGNGTHAKSVLFTSFCRIQCNVEVTVKTVNQLYIYSTKLGAAIKFNTVVLQWKVGHI